MWKVPEVAEVAEDGSSVCLVPDLVSAAGFPPPLCSLVIWL